MTESVHEAIQALIRSEGEAVELPPPHARPTVITLSREAGSNGDVVAEALASRLNLEVHDRDVIDRVAQRMHTDASAVSALDEAMGRARDLWLYSLFTGYDLSQGSFKRHLINVLLSFGRIGGIVVGRGGHLVLGRVATLRIRLTGSPEACARRYGEAHGLDAAKAREDVDRINHDRSRFVWDMFHARLNDPTTFDVVVNTDRFNDPESVADMIVDSLNRVSPEM